MAGLEAIGCGHEYFPCTDAWNSLVCCVSSSCRCRVEVHGEAATMRRTLGIEAALRAAAISPLWSSLDLTTLACCHPASSADAERGQGLLKPAHGLLQLNGGVKASGACAESEGMARVYDFHSSLRCVVVRVAASDAVKASHIQRSPLSMGGLCEPGRAISKSKKKGDCAGSLCVRCKSASGLTLGGSLPIYIKTQSTFSRTVTV